MKALSSKLTSFIDENVDDMMKERKVMTNRIDKEYSNIKQICANYFEKYDKSLKVTEVRQDMVQKKLDNWSTVLLEPMSMNDARLFAAETRLHKEEEVRVEEYDYLRHMVKMLTYTVEQDVKTFQAN